MVALVKQPGILFLGVVIEEPGVFDQRGCQDSPDLALEKEMEIKNLQVSEKRTRQVPWGQKSCHISLYSKEDVVSGCLSPRGFRHRSSIEGPCAKTSSNAVTSEGLHLLAFELWMLEMGVGQGTVRQLVWFDLLRDSRSNQDDWIFPVPAHRNSVTTSLLKLTK